MRSTVSVLTLCAAPALLLAGCSQKQEAPNDLQERSRTSDLSEAASEAAPAAQISPQMDRASAPGGVGVTAAPGVAFNYSYAFRLLPEKIAAVQEAHAAACEKMGIMHCRITGMRYTIESQDEISATLAFKLDPAAARAFGKQGIAAVTSAEGMLVNAEITGVDAGTNIITAGRQAEALQKEIAILEAQLRQPGISPETRQRLSDQIAQLRGDKDAANAEREQSAASLATTPMVFEYRSGQSFVGLDGNGTLAGSLIMAWRSFTTAIAFVIALLGWIIPWALVLAGLVWVARRFVPLVRRKRVVNNTGIADDVEVEIKN